MTNASTIVTLSLVATLLLTACGQKGALYLPNTTTTVEQANQGHKKDTFLAPTIETEIKKRREQLKADPNDY